MKFHVHAITGPIAMLCVFGLWSSTVIAELFLLHEAITVVKRGIVYAMWVMVPAMAEIAGSGLALCRNRSGWLLDHKKMCMPFIAANRLLILLPAAIIRIPR